MDLELFENETKNSTFDPQENYAFPIYYYLEIPNAIIAILSSIANILIITMIIRFHVLHTRLYFYLSNWCICNFIITISAHATLNVLGFAEVISAIALCIWMETSFAFMFGNLMFIAVIILDWYIMTFKNQSYCAVNCRRHYKFIAVSIWILVAILLVKSILYCLDFIALPLLVLVVSIAYLSVTALILVVSILRIIKLKVSSVVVEKSNLEYKLALSHFFCWLPNVIFFIFHIIFHLSSSLEYLSYMIWYSNACVIFFILYVYDSDFSTCLSTFLNVKCRVSKKENKEIPLITM